MEELIKYFESLEARIAANEERIATLEAELATMEAELDEVKTRPAPEAQVVEKVVEKIVEKPVEVIKEVIVEKPVVVPAPEPEIPEEPIAEPEPIFESVSEPELLLEEQTSPKAAVYGKSVDDIRQAISLGDRFLFQRELFGQNAELMQRTLNELNALGSFDEAQAYLNKRFQWDTESSTYQQFLITLHRRFG
jgi:chromosome segregation ATPase